RPGNPGPAARPRHRGAPADVGHRIRRCAGGPPAGPCPDHGVGTDVAGGRARGRPIDRSRCPDLTADSPTGTTTGTSLDHAPGPLKPASGGVDPVWWTSVKRLVGPR